MLISTQNDNMLFNCLQLWQSYAILSAIGASEITTLWRYTSMFIIIMFIII